MKKKAITLIIVFILLVSTQLACSFSNMLGGDSGDGPLLSPPQNEETQNGNQTEENSQTTSPGENSESESEGNSCSDAFTGSSNIPDGSEYQPGDSIEVTYTLTNTGSCVWNSDYRLVMVGGDLTPSSQSLAIVSQVAPGESTTVGVEFSAPSQDGVYLSVWKMENDLGNTFGMDNPPEAPLRIKIRVVPSGNPQPTPSPTPNPQGSSAEYTLLADECFDFNSGAIVDCSDSSADFKYKPNHPIFGELTRYNDNTFGDHHTSEPDMSACQGDTYAPMPHFIEENQYLCFKIETIASTTYGWLLVSHYNDDGMSFDFDLIGSEGPQLTAVPNTSSLVESEGEQITILEGECYDLRNGQENASCSGTFAGFLFEEVTKKSLQVAQINPNQLEISSAMGSKPGKTDCTNASYSASSVWPIQENSYYCYQYTFGLGTYYGWLRPTSFNLGGITFDYLTWK